MLDQALSGGFPAKSAILLSGGPGTGKTSLGMTFLWNGMTKMDENGIYVSLIEGKEEMYENMREFGMDLQKMEDEGRFVYLALTSSSGNEMSDGLAQLVAIIIKNGIKRVVLDSVSAITQALGHSYEGRQVLHTVIQKIVRSLGCTTLVILEGPVNISGGSGFEAFVVDGIINLEAKIPRELSILKMRGTPLPRRTFLFTISGGFNVINSEKVSPISAKTWRPVMPTDGLISSGIEDLDAILGGGFRPGSYVVMVAGAGVTLADTYLFTHAVVSNFLSQRQGVIYLPSGGVDSEEVIGSLQPYLKKTDLETLRVAEELKRDEPVLGLDKVSKYTILLSGGQNNIENDTYILFAALSELKRLTGEKPVLGVMGYDTMESKYSDVPDKLYNEIGFAIMRTRSSGDITFAVGKPNMTILPKILDMVDWHFYLTRENGTLLFQGIKPGTALYGVEVDVSGGCPKAKLVLMM
jgi:KaiC/GvpD/RAD55 family RecA-like ATPase